MVREHIVTFSIGGYSFVYVLSVPVLYPVVLTGLVECRERRSWTVAAIVSKRIKMKGEVESGN